MMRVKLKPLSIIYWSRVGFGILAAFICALLRVDRTPNPLLNGISIGLIIFILTYYILKWKFMAKVEKPSKVFTTGIGAYFLVWIVCWILFITPLIKPPIAMFAYSPQKPVVGETIKFDATNSSAPDGKIAQYKWDFGDQNVTAVTSPIIYHAYKLSANYNVTLTVKDNQGLTNKKEETLTILNVTSP
jgi:PKD repeat protein